ncbi:MAG: hypothetical protein E6J70_11840 [Deltaproteobacteria bacterium]|nr:MAG: hypothetical protein E6J70_11840 [Deltaproteobacteria bacterium]
MEGEEAQHRGQERHDRAGQDDPGAAARERRSAAHGGDGDRGHPHQRCGRDRQEDGLVQEEQAGVRAPEHPELGEARGEARGVEPHERPPASRDRRPWLGDGQRQVQDGGGCEGLEDERQGTEAARREEIEVEQEVESPHDAEGEERPALPRLGLQIEDRQPHRQERKAVECVGAERGDVVPRSEHHRLDGAALAPAGTLEDELVRRAGGNGPDELLDLCAGRYSLAVHALDARPERDAGDDAGPARPAERDDEQVVPDDEPREDAPDGGQRPDHGRGGKRDGRQ